MKQIQEQELHLRNDHNIWLTVASILSSCALVSSANAATITDNGTTAPSVNVLLQQLTAGGAQDNTRNYPDNSGPPGQTFSLASSASLTAITFLNNGDGGQPFPPVSGAPVTAAAGQPLDIQIGSVSGLGVITPLATETGLFSGTGPLIGSYITLTLDTPVALTGGTLYEFSIKQQTGAFWYGLAHSSTDVYAGGTAFNNNLTTAVGQGAPNVQFTYGGSVSPVPGNYDYVFIAQGTVVPEPSALALVALGGLGLIAGYRRRHA